MTSPTSLTAATVPAISSWSRLWSESALGAIDLGSAQPVATALLASWIAQLPWLRECSYVVDVGSGPAVLPMHLLARDRTGLSKVRWYCLDQASLPTDLQFSLPESITLQGGVDFAIAEPPGVLPQALISNFGLEYVARDAIAAACARWLAPGGRFQAVLHARDSVIDRTSAISAGDIAFALHDQSLHERADALFVAMGTVPADPIDRMMHAVDVRDAYNATVNALKRRMETRGTHSPALIDMLNGIRDLTSRVQKGHLQDARDELASRMSAYAAELDRLHDMQCHALDESALHELRDRLRNAGFNNLESGLLECPLGTVAWTLRATRA